MKLKIIEHGAWSRELPNKETNTFVQEQTFFSQSRRGRKEEQGNAPTDERRAWSLEPEICAWRRDPVALLTSPHATIPVRRGRTREKHFGLSEPGEYHLSEGRVSEMPRGRRSMTEKEWLPGALLWRHLAWASKKGGKRYITILYFFLGKFAWG